MLLPRAVLTKYTAQKNKFLIKDFFSNRDQIRSHI